MPILDIDISKVVVFTNKLEKLHRSGLPNAVRTALNSAAFDVKTNTMPKEAAADFINRTKTFFKYHSGVEMARGWNIHSMKSTVGFSSEKLNIRSTNFSVKDLEEQEYGGDIDGKSFIPLSTARASGSDSKNVLPKNRLTELLKTPVVNVNNSMRGGSDKAKFRAGQLKASQTGGLLIGNKKTKKGNFIAWKVDSSVSIASKKMFKMTALYSYRKGRKVNVKPVGFMRFASLQSANKLEKFYIQVAERQIQRLMK